MTPYLPLYGHTAQLAHLLQARASGKLQHAYLLYGPQGIGKTTLVSYFLQHLYCARSTTPPCGTCQACHFIATQSHPDIAWLKRSQGKQDITIDQVRFVREFVALSSLNQQPRAVVLEGAEYLNTEAANALLKILEEPAPGVIFFLLAQAVNLLPATIGSRCVQLSLNLVPQKTIQAMLIERGLKAETALELARLAHGRPGVALGFAQDETLVPKQLAAVKLFLDLFQPQGWTNLQTYLGAAAPDTQTEESKSPEPEALIGAWLAAAQDLLFAKLSLTPLIHYQNFRPELKLIADSTSLWELAQLAKLLLDAKTKLRANAHPRLTLECLALSILSL